MEEAIDRLKQEASDITAQINAVRSTYAEKRQILDRLEGQLAIYDERLAFAELGVYEPHFDFGDSEDFKKRILGVRAKQKTMVASKIGFDTHAMIYSDEAPALEAALHREFASLRINMSNMRKEFFRVALDEVENAVARLAPDANFFKDREAQEWHETLARRNQMLTEMQTESDKLPARI